MEREPSQAQLIDDELCFDAPARSVGEIVSGTLLCCPPDTAVSDAAALMRAAKCSSIIVVDDGRPVGIWTEHDSLAIDFDAPGIFDRPISQFMAQGLKVIDSGASVSEAGLRLKRERIRHLLVVDGQGSPVGMLSQTDVVLNHGVEHYLTFRDVRSVMSPTPPVLPSEMSLADGAAKIRAAAIEAAIVASPDWPDMGIVTERDIVRMIAERRIGTVGDAASRPAVSVQPNATLLVARNLFAEHRFRHLLVRDHAGQIVGILSFADILHTLQYEYVAQINSALRERDAALIRSRKDLHLARQVIEASLDGVMIVNQDGLIEYVNPAFTRLTGYPAKEVVGRSPRLLQSGRHDREFYDTLWTQLSRDGHWQGEIWNRRKNGETFIEWLAINAIHDDNGHILKYAAIFRDITEEKRDEERVRTLAYTDPLTSLPNRRLLTDRLELAIANAHRHGSMLAVMFLDLDLFKQINDSLGHDTGDAVLIEVTQRLLASIREGDTVARMGGDEFVILLPEVEDPADLALLAERITESVKAPLVLAAREFYITTSIGIAVYPEDGDSAETLLKCADQAMYQAKEGGRNNYQLFSAAMNARSAKRLTMDNWLRHALDNGEMSVAYQIKVDISSGAASGAEAMLRWHHPELGTVLPGEFVPLAERLGLMPSLGRWLIETSCRQAKCWLERGLPPLRLTIGLSPRQFVESDSAATVEKLLADTGFPADLLELELTEAALLDHPAEVGEGIDRLHRLGVRISIGDFGTRQTSLTALSQMPIDAVKIGRSFVEDLGRAFELGDVVLAIIHLAHALGMRAEADGVERPNQEEALRIAGCDAIRGYLTNRAVSSEELLALFDRHLLPGGG